MDTQSDFERAMTARMEQMESAFAALSRKVDDLSAAPSARPSNNGWASGTQAERVPLPRPSPMPHRPAAVPDNDRRGADWWLARAGAALTVFAVILLYQYAVARGWITPTVRVLTGVAIGAALMYWGRRMAPAGSDESAPVALRELMMGSALAAWYISAFVASMTYHLIPVSTSRILFLVLSIVGAIISLNERRSVIAIIAIVGGFLGPVMLSSSTPSIPAFAFYLAVLGALAVVLYLMRGWQSVLWLSFAAICSDIAGMISIMTYGSRYPRVSAASLSLFDMGRISVTLLTVAVAIVFARVPALRRHLVATGSDKYPEPIRSRLATNWLTNTGKFLKVFSPSAGALDSLSLWVITLAAPLAGVGLLSNAWPLVSDSVWGLIDIAIAVVAFRMCQSAQNEGDEITHLKGVAALVWGTFGTVGLARSFALPGLDADVITLGVIAIFAASAIVFLVSPRFVAVAAVARAMAGIGVLAALFSEAAALNSPGVQSPYHVRIAMSVAELMAIGAGMIAWRDMKQRKNMGDAANVLAVMSYVAFLMLDARVLGHIWTPLVSASFALAGAALLIMSRGSDNKLQRLAGGATIAIVIIRLLFVDLVGVDTIWRVLLFLGCGALFLYTSRRLQADRDQTPSHTT